MQIHYKILLLHVEILAELNLSILINAVELPSRLHILSDLNDEYDLTTNNLYNSTSHVLRTKSVLYLLFNRRICQVITPNPQSLYLQWFPALRSPAYSCLTLSKINRLREKQGKKG